MLGQRRGFGAKPLLPHGRAGKVFERPVNSMDAVPQIRTQLHGSSHLDTIDEDVRDMADDPRAGSVVGDPSQRSIQMGHLLIWHILWWKRCFFRIVLSVEARNASASSPAAITEVVTGAYLLHFRDAHTE
jgi:hypothetical protein